MWQHSKAQTGDVQAVPGVGPDSAPPVEILNEYGWHPHQVMSTRVQPGFSGATVWRVQAGEQHFALKRWPVGHPVHLPMAQIHSLMRQATETGIEMIPKVLLTRSGHSFCLQQSHLWDATTWQPGVPVTVPNDDQLQAAMHTLARLHAVWRIQQQQRTGICTAVSLQYQRLVSWTDDELAQVHASAKSTPLYQQALSLFTQHRQSAMERLKPRLTVRVPLQPCLADVWADHVLFTDIIVTGLIDFGAMRFDHPAQDLARLIGSYTCGNATRRQFALSAYASKTQELESLTILLEECGVIVGLGNWLRWLLLEQRLTADFRADERLRLLVDRLCQK